jgi:hypothetical protein
MSVTIDPATNMAGFDSSRFSYTNNQIQVDWQDLTFTRNTIVKLDVNTTVPEPSTWLLFVSGLVGIGFVRKSWRK